MLDLRLLLAACLAGCSVAVVPTPKPDPTPAAAPSATPAKAQLALRFTTTSGTPPAAWAGVAFTAGLVPGNGGTNVHYDFEAAEGGRKLLVRLWQTPDPGLVLDMGPAGATVTLDDVMATAGQVKVTSVGARNEALATPVGLQLVDVRLGPYTVNGEGLAEVRNF